MTESDKHGASRNMIILLFLSVLAASANQILYKITLNSFSSPSTNYGFFVSQFSTFLYTIQAAVISCYIIWRNSADFSAIFANAKVFFYMGLLDAASSTLGAIAGVACPGELQTILNQTIIPMTMIGDVLTLGTQFSSSQLWGSALILAGACIASSSYFSSNSSGVSSIAVIIFLLSIAPSAASNVYKEVTMKAHNLHEVHTSTMVSFWQLWIGFLFIPLLALPGLGELSLSEMRSQMSDGYQCFLGNNPTPYSNCHHAAPIFLSYILVNFLYNIMLLSITKHGSAVLLVISQALALPLTNIAFTLKSVMGDHVEPLTAADLIGLVFVCIGFITYSGYGFGTNFIVSQGPPGQMTYAHFDADSSAVVDTSQILHPDALADFLLDTYQLLQQRERSSSSGSLATPRRIDEEEMRMLNSETPIEAKALELIQQTTAVLQERLRQRNVKNIDGEPNKYYQQSA